MKSFFFHFLIPILLAGGVVYGILYLFGKSIAHFFENFFLGREIKQLQEETRRRREERERRLRERLEGEGCNHVWSDEFSGFPQDVCIRCGIGKNIPDGSCDHRWEAVPGPAPGSRCKLCGDTFGGMKETEQE